MTGVQTCALPILSFKRLFVRDGIKRETFAIRMYQSATLCSPETGIATDPAASNVDYTSISGSAIFTDIGASANQLRVFGGNVGTIVNAANTSQQVGLLFYDAGTAVFDMAKIFSGSQKMSGSIPAINSSGIAVIDRKSTRLNSSHIPLSRMPSSA